MVLQKMLVLGIDTSCDDTSASVVRDGREILSNVVSNQEAVHRRYRGVVPELASRRHMEMIWPTVSEALSSSGLQLHQMDAVAVCSGPGLIGSLLVGCSFGKAIAYTAGKPLIGINHLEGHIYANFLEPNPPEFPFLALVVSGGHTSLFLAETPGHYLEVARTLDDAAGEAYDKVAKILGIGYPGGPVIDRLSKTGNPRAVSFPRPFLHGRADFSFSGLKTAVLYHHQNHPGFPVEDTVAGFQESVVEVLVRKTINEAIERQVPRIILSGGVAANSRLRLGMQEAARSNGLKLFLPSPSLCTDNAAMIAAAAYPRLMAGQQDGLKLNPKAHMPLA